jgi:ribosomal protein S18 acetylase RimI-like enzyme
MSEYTFRHANSKLFAAYHAIYSEADIMCYDWNERLSDLISSESCYFLYEDSKPIGGLTIADNAIGSAFLVAPFCDRSLFWQLVLSYIKVGSSESEIKLNRMQKKDVEVLISHGATIKWSHQRMCRPTDIVETKPVDGFVLVEPGESDIPEIIQVVYSAHSNGYTTQVYGHPAITNIEEAINRRFGLFTKTNTWNQSVVAKRTNTNEIAGVCIAGIYPEDLSNCFATIHQVSVLPQFRGKGLAKAMMLHSIGVAHLVSPVVSLGVLIGNPAENLYRKLGFIAGPSFTDMVYEVKE